MIAQEGEPARVAHDAVERVAVDHQIPPAVGGDMHRLAGDQDAAEVMVEIVAQRLVVIAGHVDHVRPFARLAQNLLDDVVMRLRPIPPALEPPAIDDVAHEIKPVGFVLAQEVEQEIGLAAGRAQMDVRQEDRPPARGPVVRAAAAREAVRRARDGVRRGVVHMLFHRSGHPDLSCRRAISFAGIMASW